MGVLPGLRAPLLHGPPKEHVGGYEDDESAAHISRTGATERTQHPRIARGAELQLLPLSMGGRRPARRRARRWGRRRHVARAVACGGKRRRILGICAAAIGREWEKQAIDSVWGGRFEYDDARREL